MTNKLLLTISLLALIMAACAPAPTPTATPIETAEPTATETPEPTATRTSEPTATDTPEPTVTDTPEPTETDTPEPTETNTPLSPTNTSAPISTAPPANTAAPVNPTPDVTSAVSAPPASSIASDKLWELTVTVKRMMENMAGMIDTATSTGTMECTFFVNNYLLLSSLTYLDLEGGGTTTQKAYETYLSGIYTVLGTSEPIYLHCNNGTQSDISAEQWASARQGLTTGIDLMSQALSILSG